MLFARGYICSPEGTDAVRQRVQMPFARGYRRCSPEGRECCLLFASIISRGEGFLGGSGQTDRCCPSLSQRNYPVLGLSGTAYSWVPLVVTTASCRLTWEGSAQCQRKKRDHLQMAPQTKEREKVHRQTFAYSMPAQPSLHLSLHPSIRTDGRTDGRTD